MQQVVEDSEVNFMKSSSFMAWKVCFAASLFFFFEFIQGNMFASIADNIMQDFHIQADKMTYLSSMYYLSNVIFLFVAGFLLDRFSTKKTIIVSMLLCVLSTFVLGYAHSFYMALISRFITGMGSAFCFLGPIRIASRWFPPQRMALVTGAIVTMAMTGGMLAQYPLTLLVLHVGWRHAVLEVGVLGLVMIMIMCYWIKDAPKTLPKTISAKKKNIFSVAKLTYLNPQIVRASLYTSLMNMAVAVFGAMMGPLYLIQRLGVGKGDAALVNSMLFLGAILGGPILGWCSDKLNLRVIPMKLGALVALATMLLVLYAPVSLGMMGFLFFLLGFFTAAQVISYALVAESSDSSMTATAVSLVSILTQGGYIIYQNLFSYLLLRHGEVTYVDQVPTYSLMDYQFAAMILPLGLIIAFCILFRLKETHCRNIVEK